MHVKAHLSKTIASSWLSLIIVSVCQLIMVPVALTELDKADFALFAVITQVLMAVMLAEMGVRSACARLLIDAAAKGKEAYQKTWMASVCVFGIQALLMLIVIVAISPFIADWFKLDQGQRKTAQWIFLSVGVLNTVNYAMSICATALLAGQRLSSINFVTGLSALVQLIVFTVAIKSGAYLWSYPFALFVSYGSSQYLMVWQMKTSQLGGGICFKDCEWGEIKTVFRLGWDVFVAAMFSMVMGNSLLIFSGHLLTLEQTAILAVNLKLVNMMTQILQRVPGSASPMLMKMVSEGQDAQFRVWWKLVSKLCIGIAIWSAGMFVIWNKWVVALWTSEEMVMTSAAVFLLSLIPFRYLTHYQFVNSLTIYKEIRKVKWFLVWEVVLYVCLAWVLGSLYGLIGLLSANLLSMLGGALPVGVKWFSYYSSISRAKLVSLLARLLSLLGGVVLITVACIQTDLLDSLIGSAGLSVAWIMLFTVVSYLVVLDGEDRPQVNSFIKSLLNRCFMRTV